MKKEEIKAAKIQFGENLKKIREGKGMTLKEVEAGCSLEDTKISKIEQGKFDVRLSTILELAKGLEVVPSKLVDF